MVRRRIAVLLWGAATFVGTWLLYDVFVLVILALPISIGMAIASFIITKALTTGDGSPMARMLRLTSAAVATGASLCCIAYVVWWGFAFDAADTGSSNPDAAVESWLFGGCVVQLAVLIFLPGVAWLQRAAIAERKPDRDGRAASASP